MGVKMAKEENSCLASTCYKYAIKETANSKINLLKKQKYF